MSTLHSPKVVSVVVTALVLLLAATLVLGAVWLGGTTDAPGETAAEPAPATSGSEPEPRDGDAERPARKRSPEAGPTTPVPAASGNDVDDRVTVRPQKKLDAVPSTQDVVVADRVRVRIRSMRITRAEAHGPGEIAGRALAVTVRLHNTTNRAFPLSGAALTAYDADDAPLAALVSPEAVDPFGGRVPARGHRDATYLFQLPQEHPTPITVTVSPAPGLPVAVLVGDPS